MVPFSFPSPSGASSQVSFLPLDNVHRPPTLQRSEDGKSFLLRYPLSEKNATVVPFPPLRSGMCLHVFFSHSHSLCVLITPMQEVPGMQGFSCNLVELRESQVSRCLRVRRVLLQYLPVHVMSCMCIRVPVLTGGSSYRPPFPAWRIHCFRLSRECIGVQKEGLSLVLVLFSSPHYF